LWCGAEDFWERLPAPRVGNLFAHSRAVYSVEDTPMNVSGYTTEELEIFKKVLDRAVAEADFDIPVELMARRLFVIARTGERDQDRLVSAVLGRSMPPPLPRPVLVSPPPLPFSP